MARARRIGFHASPRQVEILKLVAEGRSDKQIAASLRLSITTVRTYLRRLYQDQQLSGRAEAAVRFLRSRDELKG
jgi:DNA-binding NarL/FixJ family response regulator